MKPTRSSFDAEISLDTVIAKAQSLVDGKIVIPPRTGSALKQPIFVVGSPRSGTTVLGQCLGAHPLCVTNEESLILLPLWRIYIDLYASGLPTGIINLKEYISGEQLLSSLGQLADTVFTGLLGQAKASRYVDHTPWYGLISSFVTALYPDAQYIHVIRDGRQVARSLQESFHKGYLWAGNDLEARCQLWVAMVQGTLETLSQKDNFSVYYSHLCHSPDTVLHSVSDFIGVPFDKTMLRPLHIHHAASIVGEKFGTASFTEQFNSEGWPTDWDNSDREIFRRVAGNLMLKLFGENWDTKIN